MIGVDSLGQSDKTVVVRLDGYLTVQYTQRIKCYLMVILYLRIYVFSDLVHFRKLRCAVATEKSITACYRLNFKTQGD